jgi:SAM-dependent methyltransferase
MVRSTVPEILDSLLVPEEAVRRAHIDLNRTHRWLGHNRAIIRALRGHRHPLRRVLDVGCGHGGLLEEIQLRLGVEVVGVDLRPPREAPVPVVHGDAVWDPLPPCDAAVAVCLVHHLSREELVELIRNVGRSAGRFIVLDLVRHPLPLGLFRVFVAPFVYRINALDGIQSIRRSYTPAELNAIAHEAVGGRAAVVHRVAPLYAYQLVDIRW